MRAVVQRVSSASVTVADEVVGKIDLGLLVLLGVGQSDTDQDLDYLYRKAVGLRIFEDAEGKMNLDLAAVGGSLLVVSQFTLYGDIRKGRRPSFVQAGSPKMAREYYQKFCDRARADGITVQTGIFQAQMEVALVNDGPVTIWIDSAER